MTVEDGSGPVGSIHAVEAKALLENAPFSKARLFESVEVIPWKCGSTRLPPRTRLAAEAQAPITAD